MTTFINGPVILMAISTIGAGLFRFSTEPAAIEPDILGHPHFKLLKSTTPSAEVVKTIDVSSYTLEAQGDHIQDLPGLDYDPGFQQFSGYLTVDPDHGRNIFYWYVESQGDPANDPVVLWTNGGPGCSGFVGFGTEHGPYYISANGTLSPNDYSWNKIANVLYIEQPAGVGFSYSDTEADYTTGDGPAARDNYQLIREFMKRFPERQTNPFYISSESYGGHYMPQLTMEILKQNTDGLINFQGMMVGNPFVDPFSNTVTQIKAFYSHGLLPKPLFDQWSSSCTLPSNFESKECEKMMEEMFKGLYGNINPYALDYPICIEEEEISSTSRNFNRRLDAGAASSQAKQLMNYSTAGGPPFLPTEDVYRPCADKHLDIYLNRKDVRTAIHVNPKVKKWYDCSGVVNYASADFDASIIDLYKDVVQKAIEHSFQVFVFSGDDDSVCSTAGTQYWIYDLGFAPKADHLWKSWKVEKEVAGFVTKFELGKTDGQFTFVTVHGAGHEVPAYRPMEALEMFRRVLAKDW